MPLTLALGCLLAALAAHTRRPTAAARAALWLSLVAAVLATHPITAWVLVRPLEVREPSRQEPVSSVAAIAVLSGDMREDAPRSMTMGEQTTLRTLCGLDLYRRLGGRTLVVTGGTTNDSHGISLAALMARRLQLEGVPAAEIVLEDRAANTYENGVFTARLLRARGLRRVALVTDPVHLPRAARVFRGQQLDVWPVGCSPLARRAPSLPWGLVPSGRAAYLVDLATHEWLGMLWYAWRGYFD